MGHVEPRSTSVYLTMTPPLLAEASRRFAAHGQPLTRYGIYKIVRRHAARFDDPRTGRKVSPHTFRHYVDGRVMWLAAASPLVAEPRVLVPAT